MGSKGQESLGTHYFKKVVERGLAVPAHHAGRDLGEEPEAARPVVARDRRLRAVADLGLLDRTESAALLPLAGSAGGADRGARAAGVLRAASLAESAECDQLAGAFRALVHRPVSSL